MRIIGAAVGLIAIIITTQIAMKSTTLISHRQACSHDLAVIAADCQVKQSP